MKKVLVGMLIGLGLVIGSGFVNEVSTCDDCNSVYDFAEEVIEKHIHRDKCTETHYLCGNEECGGFYCENLPCWCGDCNGEASDYILEQDHDHRHELCQLCGGLYGVDECNISCNCEISGIVEYQVDGDTVIEYSDGSCVLINDEEAIYLMWLPETEDKEYEFANEEELMNAIEEYHGRVSDLTYPKSTDMNPFGYESVANELDKLSDDAKFIIESGDLYIIYSDDLIELQEEECGFNIAGYYNTINNRIVMKQDNQAIEQALLHEIGHAIDFNIGLRYNQEIIDSYESYEVEFKNNSDYYYSCIEEYIAESIEYYFNGTLDENTVMYQELNEVLGK